jgi:signal transduction histidine kinase
MKLWPHPKSSKPRRPRWRYRFTFFQRQFVSHLIIALLILLLLGAGATYYLKVKTFQSKEDELKAASNAIVRLLRQTGDHTGELTNYRTILISRKISFVVLDKSGDVILKDTRMITQPYRGVAFITVLKQHMYSDTKHYFLVEKETDPVMVWPRTFKMDGVDTFLFVISPVEGVTETIHTINRTILYASGLIFMLAILFSLIASRNLSRGVKSLRLATQRIAEGDYTVRTRVRRSDELGDLSNDFNSMAEQLESTSRRLEEYDMLRRQFILDVTHELRTPLTSIRGIIEGLKSNLVSEPQERYKYYSIIEKETFRLIRLINELLDMEKIQSGLITLHPMLHNVRELFEVVNESLEVLVQEKNLGILIECPPDLHIYGDYDRLIQILINLVKNAIQFTEYGTIQLSATENDDFTIVSIQDSGQGMSSDELAKIWERFYKVDPSRTKDRSETGLGLPIVKNLVTAHHGKIEASSVPGIGTVFTFYFPKMKAIESSDRTDS